MRFTRRHLLRNSLAAGVLGGAARLPLGAQPAGPPNVLLILVDDLGYGDLASYGAGDMETPHIDSLVNGGVRLDQFYANSPVCSPTRAALLTGRYPDRAGVPGVIRTRARDNWGYLYERAVLLPRMVKQAGYHTGMVGKWHLGLEQPNTPNGRGFDSFYGFLGDMMDDYYLHRRHGINYMRENLDTIDPEGHATNLFSNAALRYFEERQKDGGNWFLYLAYNAPHAPIQPPQEWLDRVRARRPNLSEQRAALVALIEHLDDGIGRVIQGLRDSGFYDNTLVIFTSDNGGQSNVGANNGPLRGGKQNMYEGGIRVPMAADWPGMIDAGTRSNAVAMTMDLYPTICEAVGSNVPAGIDGRSILPILTGQEESLPERDLVWVRREGNMTYRARDYYALRRGDWKLVQNSPFEDYELYNLREDPREQTNLADAEPEVYRSLVESLMQHIQGAGRIPWQAPEP